MAEAETWRCHSPGGGGGLGVHLDQPGDVDAGVAGDVQVAAQRGIEQVNRGEYGNGEGVLPVPSGLADTDTVIV